jgi:hypothetical protein
VIPTRLAEASLHAHTRLPKGSFTLEQEGRYVALCFVPTGLSMARLEELGVDASMLGPDTDPASLPAESQAFLNEVMANPPHAFQGMIQEFSVAAADSSPGPLPGPTTEMAPAESAAA